MIGEFPNKATQFKKNGKRAVEIGRKGGKSSSNKQRLSAYIRASKKWGINAKVAGKVWALLQSKELSAADWFKHIDVLEEMAKKDPRLHKDIINFKRDWYKAAHGESNQINVQANDSKIMINIIDPRKDENNVETE